MSRSCASSASLRIGSERLSYSRVLLGCQFLRAQDQQYVLSTVQHDVCCAQLMGGRAALSDLPHMRIRFTSPKVVRFGVGPNRNRRRSYSKYAVCNNSTMRALLKSEFAARPNVRSSSASPRGKQPVHIKRDGFTPLQFEILGSGPFKVVSTHITLFERISTSDQRPITSHNLSRSQIAAQSIASTDKLDISHTFVQLRCT